MGLRGFFSLEGFWVDLYNSTPKKPLVFCLVSVAVKFRVRVSLGFRTKDGRFYWGRNWHKDSMIVDLLNVFLPITPSTLPYTLWRTEHYITVHWSNFIISSGSSSHRRRCVGSFRQASWSYFAPRRTRDEGCLVGGNPNRNTLSLPSHGLPCRGWLQVGACLIAWGEWGGGSRFPET